MAAVAFLHYSVGTGTACRVDAFPPAAVSGDTASGACATCSTSTPSSSWRSQCSFSCGCAACSASAPGASGRPTIPISARDAVRPSTERQGRGAAGPRAPMRRSRARAGAEPAERWKGIAEPGSASAAGLDAIVPRGPELRSQAFPHRRARRLRDDRDRLCAGRPAHAEEFARRARSMTASKPPSRTARRAARRSRPASSRSTSADIIGAEMRGQTAQVTVRFVSQLVSVTRDSDGQRDRRQSRQGHRRHRRVDVRARRVLARSELEAGRHRSRAMTAWRRWRHASNASDW